MLNVLMPCWLQRRLYCVVLWGGLVATVPICAGGQSVMPEHERASPESEGRWVPSLRTMGQDALDIVETPFRLSPSQKLLTLGGIGFVASAAWTLDASAYRHARLRSGTVSRATRPLATPGRAYDRLGPDRTALGTAGLLAASGLLLQRRSLTRTSVRVVEALVYTKLVTGFAKSALNRNRPFAASDPFTADPGEFSSEHHELSMPSGHTARAFAVASVLTHQFDRWYVSVPAYAVAGSVGVERIRSGDHWPTDVLVGGVLGYLIGRSLSTPSRAQDVTYTPILNTDRIGLSIRF